MIPGPVLNSNSCCLRNTKQLTQEVICLSWLFILRIANAHSYWLRSLYNRKHGYFKTKWMNGNISKYVILLNRKKRYILSECGLHFKTISFTGNKGNEQEVISFFSLGNTGGNKQMYIHLKCWSVRYVKISVTSRLIFRQFWVALGHLSRRKTIKAYIF